MMYKIKQRRQKSDKKCCQNIGLNESVQWGIYTKTYEKTEDLEEAVWGSVVLTVLIICAFW